MPHIVIKNLDNLYSEKIIDLILTIQQKEFGVPITISDQPDLMDIEKYYLSDGGSFLGAFYEDELVGTIAYLNIGHQAAAIRKMFVKKEFRGKELNIAAQLLYKLEQECRQNEIFHLLLGTNDKLKASHRFYEKNAFTPIEKQALPSYFPLMQVDTIFYEKQLKNVF